MALASCHSPQHEARRMVRRAERLADTLPDSTARLIDSVLRMPVYFGERQRMDMALLQAEALFGDRGQEISPLMDDDFFDDHATLSTSPELERAAAFYAKKKKFDKAAHAALYSGFVQQHYNDNTAAMQSFKEAEQYGGKAGDSLTVAVAEYKMGKMLYNEYLEEDALNMLKSAETLFGTNYAERALAQNMMAVCYMVVGDIENAERCLKKSLSYPSAKIKSKTLNNFAVLYRIQKDYDNAINCLQQIDIASDSSLLPTYYLNLGIVFSDKGNLDSAAYYYNCIEPILRSPKLKKETLVAAYNALSRFAESQENILLVLQYHEKREAILSEVASQHQEQSIYRIQRQYDYKALQNTMNLKLINRQRIIIIIGGLLLMASVTILMLQFKHRQMRKAEEEMKELLDTLKKDLRQSVKTSLLDEELSARLRLMLSAVHIEKRSNDPKKEWHPLVKQVMNGKEDLFEAAKSYIERAYPNLFASLLSQHPDLSETEARVCMLSCTDLSNAEIAEFLGLSLNTVNKCRSTLRKKLNLGANALKEQLRNTLAKP